MTNEALAGRIAETLWKRELIYSGDENEVRTAVRTLLDMHRPEPEGGDEKPAWVAITEDTDG